MNINLGPQHPAAHGVLRLIVQLNGEIIEKVDPHIGLLHRGTEKLIEEKTYLQALPYFDRFDYVSMLSQEHAYCLAVETLLGTTNYSANIAQVRVLFDELTRILNHMLAVACHALDVGSMSPIFWAFEEREKLMEFYERVSGARMHAAFYRPNEFYNIAITTPLLEDITWFSKNCLTSLNEIHNILTFNKVWKQRLINIGSYTYNLAVNYGLTGVMGRCTGLKRDIRLSTTEAYSNYYYLNFRSYVGKNGDSYDRFLLRMNEMSESLFIINQIVQKLITPQKLGNKSNLQNEINKAKLTKISYGTEYNVMEKTIAHFKQWSECFSIKTNTAYSSIESPKGELGVTLIADGTNNPVRCKLRSPAYHHLQVLPHIAKGHYLADLVTLLGTIDIVFGEIDR